MSKPEKAVYSKGLEGVVAAQTKMSFIDGEKGILEYVGIPIGELANHSTFEETVFLLWNLRLPKAGELKEFGDQLKARYELPKGIEERLLALPKAAKPMHMIRTMVSMLSMWDATPDANDTASLRDKVARLKSLPASGGALAVDPLQEDAPVRQTKAGMPGTRAGRKRRGR